MFPTEIVREIWNRLHIDQKFIRRQVCKTFMFWFNESIDFDEEIKLIGEHVVNLKNNNVYINGKKLQTSIKARIIFDNIDLAFGYNLHSLLCFNNNNIGHLIYRNGKISKLEYPHLGEYYYFAGFILEYDNPEFGILIKGSVKIQDSIAIVYNELKISIIYIPEKILLKSFNVPCEPNDFSIVCMDTVKPGLCSEQNYKGVIVMNVLLENIIISKIICS